MIQLSDLPEREFSKQETHRILKFFLDNGILAIESGKSLNSQESNKKIEDIKTLMQFFREIRKLI